MAAMLTIFKRGASDEQSDAHGRRPAVALSEADGALVCKFSGVWVTRTVETIDAEMRKLEQRKEHSRLVLDLADVERVDTAGAWIFDRLVFANENRGVEARIDGASESAKILIEAVRDAALKKQDASRNRGPGTLLAFFEWVGRGVYHMRDDFIASMHILGATIRGGQMKLGRGHGINPAAIASHIDRMGVGAIPVVVLMSAIVGAIVAQQGAYQLRYFGAEIFVVDLVGILVLRELGVLMTAIMIAGRSGSAITAEIGSMKMREEVDALTVIGLNPVGVLVFPRLVALVIALPCLTIAANFAALGGAILVTWLYSDISPAAFIVRLRASIDVSTIVAGLIKAPFMALIIGILASVEGLKVGGSAESLGAHVTASVVKAIFVVIIVDGMFAIFYAAIDF